jgi:hypothetical protein
MKALVLYRPNSEYSRITEQFIRDYKSRYPTGRVEVVNIDTRDGIATASLYDVMSYPAILVIQDNGALQKDWQGPVLPMFDEIASYVHA